MTTGAASAAVVDFTSDATVTAAAAGNPFTLDSGGVTISVLTAPGAASFDDTVDGSASFCQAQGGDFACDNDGLGISDDEVGPGESVILTFSQAVNVTSLAFLDLFVDPDAGQDETVMVMVNGAPATTLDALIEFEPGATGFARFATNLGLVTTLALLTGEGNDGVGVRDFALAGVEFSPVPVPAAGLLFATAAIGGGIARRKHMGA